MRPIRIVPLLLTLLLAAAPDPASLRPGQPVARELAAEEAQTWTAELAGGRVWRISVEQRGIDVVLAATGPDGSRVAVDNPVDRQGLESLVLEPAVSGSYRIEVRAREIGAPSGRYEIRRDELPADSTRRDAERAMTVAGRAYFEGSAEARRTALASWREALPLWRALGDRHEEARTLYALAVVSRLTNATREALELGRQVLPLWQQLGEPLWEAATRNEIGLDLWLLGQNAEARESFAEANAIQRQIGDLYGEAGSASNLCLMNLSQGELRSGIDCYQRALPRLREAGALALEGAGLTSLGRAWDVLGEPEEALAAYGQALERMRATGDRRGEARTLNNLGVLHRELGNFQEALARYAQALEVFRALDDRRWQARVLGNLGTLYLGLGENTQALASYEQALALWREVGDRAGESFTLISLGELRTALQDIRGALDPLNQALEIARATGDRRGEGIALSHLGRIRLLLGDPAAAKEAFTQALEKLQGAGDLPRETDTRRNLGNAQRDLGEADAALASLTAARETAVRARYRAGELRVLEALVKLERGMGRSAEARAHAEEALALVEDVRTRIGVPDLRTSYSNYLYQIYDLHRDLLLEAHRADPRAGYDRQALESSERARARTLLELLSEARVDLRGGAGAALAERQRSLQQRLSAKAERALRERDPKMREALEEEQGALLRDLDLVDAEIRERSPDLAALTHLRPLRAPEIQALLDPETLLLVYALGEERSALWAVTTASLDSYELPGRAALEQAARKLHDEMSAFDPEDREAETRLAAALGRLLLAPVAGRLGSFRRLAVEADGALHYIPFGALPAPESGVPLLASHEVVYVPSISALAVQRRTLQERAPAPRQIAILADPVFDPHDPRLAGAPSTSPKAVAVRGDDGTGFARLPASRQEAEEIAALAPQGQSLVLLDTAASRTRVLGGALAGYRIVHFATHGVIDAEHPALSGLALSNVGLDGQPEEGFLHLRDIYGLRLGADLVVLSGCRTALGREVKGEGLVGLTRGFQYAGAPRVVASLWRVEDRATAALMSRFYRALWTDRLPPAAALRAAQLSIRQERRWRDPWFWAAFVLEGDWMGQPGAPSH